MSVPHPLQEAARRLDGDVGSLRTRITQLEALVKARDKEVDRLSKQVDQGVGLGYNPAKLPKTLVCPRGVGIGPGLRAMWAGLRAGHEASSVGYTPPGAVPR